MSCSVTVLGFSSPDNEEYQKHYKAVKFCVENELSFPKETSEFFKGRVGSCGDEDIDDFCPEYALECIKNGFNVMVPMEGEAECGGAIVIKVADIPKECDKLIVKYV